MANFKRGRTWWTHFFVNGQRYRQSLRTRDWREAQAREKELITQASQGKLTPTSQQFARLAFSEAADRYLADRLAHLAPRSVQREKECLVPLKAFYSATPLTRIDAETILAYFARRKTASISNTTINRELCVLRGVLKRAKRWYLVAEDVKPLPMRRNVGRALSQDEKLRLLRVAANRPDWQVARCAAIIALNTTMRGCELKGLRWRDVNFLDRILTVGRSKTEAGERVIPLNDNAMEAILMLYRRAQAVGGTEPDHHVFPACENGKIDPTRPQKSWRSAWRSLRKRAGLARLRFHDLRHHAITELAESQASDQTIMAIAGHVSPRMLAHYSHVRLEAKRRALDALATRPGEQGLGGGSEGSYDTKDDTNPVSDEHHCQQDAEYIGGREGIRTPDLRSASAALSQLSYPPTAPILRSCADFRKTPLRPPAFQRDACISVSMD